MGFKSARNPHAIRSRRAAGGVGGGSRREALGGACGPLSTRDCVEVVFCRVGNVGRALAQHFTEHRVEGALLREDMPVHVPVGRWIDAPERAALGSFRVHLGDRSVRIEAHRHAGHLAQARAQHLLRCGLATRQPLVPLLLTPAASPQLPMSSVAAGRPTLRLRQ